MAHNSRNDGEAHILGGRIRGSQRCHNYLGGKTQVTEGRKTASFRHREANLEKEQLNVLSEVHFALVSLNTLIFLWEFLQRYNCDKVPF